MVSQACQQAARWNQSRTDTPFVMRCDFSANEFNRADVVSNIATAVTEADLDPKLLSSKSPKPLLCATQT